jgi:rSAM/selenodomain-associated transferase 1
MNAGAAVARGDVLLFLHADTRLPAAAVEAMARALRAGHRWGRFDAAIRGEAALLPAVSALMNLRSRLTGIATGDQAMFATREAFAAVGGFPALPLMEDIAMSAALRHACGAPACLRERVVTSGRRWDARGPLRTVLSMWRLRFDYRRGVDPLLLARRYGATRAAPALHVFAKRPVPGAVKTRLAATIGAVAAAGVYRQLAETTLATAAAARDAGIVGNVVLWCDPDASAAPFAAWRDRFGVTLRAQRGSDLGERMRFALASSLARGSAGIVIGTDAPALDVAYLARAVRALAYHDAAIGPAEDGGYVLLGLTRDADVFSGIEWGTGSVLTATCARLVGAQLSFAQLPTLWDVDTAADLERYREWQGSTAAAAPRIPEPGGSATVP